MYSSKDITNYLEKIRVEKGMKISEFTSGITSTRNYSRYLSGELDVPFQTFAKLLNRLDTVVKDFIVYAFNDWQHGRYNEFLLAEYIRLNQFDDAKELYETMKNQEFSSDVGRKLLPFSIMKMNYELGEITLAAFLNYGRSILNLKKILSSRVITKEEVETLFIYLEYCQDLEKQKIIEYLLKVVKKEEVHLVSWNLPITELQVITNTLHAIVFKKEYTENDHKNIKYLINEVLAIVDDIRFENTYDDFTQIMIEYYNRTNNKEKYNEVVFYYFSSLLSRRDGDDLLKREFSKNKEAREIFVKLLSDRKLLNRNFTSEMRDNHEY